MTDVTSVGLIVTPICAAISIGCGIFIVLMDRRLRRAREEITRLIKVLEDRRREMEMAGKALEMTAERYGLRVVEEERPTKH